MVVQQLAQLGLELGRRRGGAQRGRERRRIVQRGLQPPPLLAGERRPVGRAQPPGVSEGEMRKAGPRSVRPW